MPSKDTLRLVLVILQTLWAQGKMGRMKSRIFISFLLLAALYIPFLFVPNASSQSTAITTTTTIRQLPLGQCSQTSLAFSVQAGMEITGTFGSDVSINFYILSQKDFDGIQNVNCHLSTSAKPLYIQEHSVGHDNPYRSLPFPTNGTYYFVFVYPNSGTSQLASGHVTVELSFPPSITLITTGASSTKSSSSIIVRTTQNATESATAASTGPSFGTFGLIGLIVALGLVASVMVFMKRGRSQTGQKVVLKQETVKKEVRPEGPQQKPSPAGQNISTGYPELDTMLAGGLPVGFAVLLVSPPCDERDLLFRKIIESSLSMGSPVFFLSRDLSRTQDFASRYQKDFYVFSPQADKITATSGNVFKIQTLQNLSDLNISFTKAVEALPKTGGGKLIIIDILSDVLLEHKALTTRKWLDDFIGKRKAEGFTVLGTLNPLISSKQDSQTIVDLFDGIIEIYEKELRERARRFLIVKKMYGRRYTETELMLDKDKLF
jgi:KaiC/GvpD/RAD55 family RecA-like ATPase